MLRLVDRGTAHTKKTNARNFFPSTRRFKPAAQIEAFKHLLIQPFEVTLHINLPRKWVIFVLTLRKLINVTIIDC